jgi:hypothetical protein
MIDTEVAGDKEGHCYTRRASVTFPTADRNYIECPKRHSRIEHPELGINILLFSSDVRPLSTASCGGNGFWGASGRHAASASNGRSTHGGHTHEQLGVGSSGDKDLG